MTVADSTKEETTEKVAVSPAKKEGAEGGYAPRSSSSGSSSSGSGSYGANGGYGDRAGADRVKAGAMEVAVDHNIEKAIRVLKRKLIKEGLFKELKSRRYYEKPSERKKRKVKESMKKVRKDEARAKKNPMMLS